MAFHQLRSAATQLSVAAFLVRCIFVNASPPVTSAPRRYADFFTHFCLSGRFSMLLTFAALRVLDQSVATHDASTQPPLTGVSSPRPSDPQARHRYIAMLAALHLR